MCRINESSVILKNLDQKNDRNSVAHITKEVNKMNVSKYDDITNYIFSISIELCSKVLLIIIILKFRTK